MAVKISLPVVIQQIVTFCGVGAINTALSLLIILFLSEFMGVHYVMANITGYIFGLSSGFIMHKRFTFKSQNSNKAVKNQIFAFLVIFIIGYLSQLGLLMFLVENIQLPNILSQITAWFLYVAISFTGNKFFTFEGVKHE